LTAQGLAFAGGNATLVYHLLSSGSFGFFDGDQQLTIFSTLVEIYL